MKYFGKRNCKGKNEDINRHKQEEIKLLADIEEAKKRLDAGCKWAAGELAAKERFLRILRESKAEMVSDLFKRKDS